MTDEALTYAIAARADTLLRALANLDCRGTPNCIPLNTTARIPSPCEPCAARAALDGADLTAAPSFRGGIIPNPDYTPPHTHTRRPL